MNRLLNALGSWLLSVVLGLFLLRALTLPFALKGLSAGSTELLDCLAAHTAGKLVRDSATTLNQDGAAHISLFENTCANGINACMGACLALLLIAGVVFVLYVPDRRRKKNG